MAVKILIDSASDYTQAEAKERGIHLIPMLITFGETEYFDGIDITTEEFYHKLTTSPEFPKTSQINPFRYKEKFKKLTSDGDEVICITMSSKLSGTYASACLAAQDFDGQVYVVDSYTATVGERMLCEYAITLVKKGLSAKEIVDELNKVKYRIIVTGIVDILKYLQKGGRISKVAALAGEMLSVKPIPMVIDGEIIAVGKVIGSKKAHRFLNTVVEKKGIDFDMPHCLLWTGNSDEKLKSYVEDSKKVWGDKITSMPSFLVGPTIGTHLGPNCAGLAFFTKEESNQ